MSNVVLLMQNTALKNPELRDNCRLTCREIQNIIRIGAIAVETIFHKYLRFEILCPVATLVLLHAQQI